MPLDESRGETDGGEKGQLCFLMVQGVDDSRDQNVRDEQQKNRVGDCEAPGRSGSQIDANHAPQQCDHCAPALVEMATQKNQKENADDHVNGDTSA